MTMTCNTLYMFFCGNLHFTISLDWLLVKPEWCNLVSGVTANWFSMALNTHVMTVMRTSQLPRRPGIVLYQDFVSKFCNNWWVARLLSDRIIGSPHYAQSLVLTSSLSSNITHSGQIVKTEFLQISTDKVQSLQYSHSPDHLVFIRPRPQDWPARKWLG